MVKVNYSGAERFFRGSVVIARRAEDFLASWPEYIEYAADTGEYAAGVLLIPMTDVEDFTLMSLVYEGGSVGDEPVFTAVDLAQFPEIGPEKPLLLSMTFGEIFPAYGFSYVDGTGARRTFGITESGRDGSLEVTEIRIARG